MFGGGLKDRRGVLWGGLEAGSLGEGGIRGLEGIYSGCMGLGPGTTPSLGCPPKLLLKLDDFSNSFGDFSIFL
jgi:hypothetical protein